MTTRQYARLLSEWIASIGLDPHLFGTHSLRRTKASLIYVDRQPPSGPAIARPHQDRLSPASDYVPSRGDAVHNHCERIGGRDIVRVVTGS